MNNTITIFGTICAALAIVSTSVFAVVISGAVISFGVIQKLRGF